MDSLYSKSSDNFFYNESLNGIYGLFLCRGDVDRDTCQACVNNATQFLPKNCSSSLGAVVWYDACLLRYSSSNFFGEISLDPDFCMCNEEETISPEEDSEVLSWLDNSTVKAQNSTMLFDAQNKVLNSNMSRPIDILTQCSRDLNGSSCYSCLKNIKTEIRAWCPRRPGWRCFAPSCFARYEKYPFFQSSPPPQPVPNAGIPPQPVPNAGIPPQPVPNAGMY
ncbi:hypothetical protein SLEP1_g51518 [Rubroshorea leprosula]|uniref:Gnk2-homologous domain-containing protein n=1 Tax=Rubroshorea leprosula TaxID=152421 RepID=A0AAV5M3M8_9ROSI|nr:hypothetical protein SLEP1_g51518 [Rubroshorea leprosula]